MLRSQEIPLGPAQTTIAFIDEEHKNNKSNDRSVGVNLTGTIDKEVLTQAFHKLIERHEVLRAFKDKNPYLTVKDFDPNNPIPFEVIDATSISPIPAIEDTNKTLVQLKRGNFLNDRFDLTKGPLWRAALIKFSDNQYHFVMLFNHIIVDEISIGYLLKDLSVFYNSILNKTEPKLEPLEPLSKLNFSLSNEETEKRVDFWEKELDDLNQLHLETDKEATKGFPFPGKRKSFTLNGNLLKALKEKFPGYSSHVILLSCFYVLLNKLSNDTDITVGITSANRRNIQAPIVDALFNMLPLRTKIDELDNFEAILKKVSATQSKALPNQLPFNVIMERALSERTQQTLSFKSPYKVLFVLNGQKPTLTFDNTKADYPAELHLEQSKMPLFGFNLDELYDGNFKVTIEYNTDRFNDDAANDLYGRYETIVQSILKKPKQAIKDISALLSKDKNLIHDYNHTFANPANDLFLHDYLHTLARKIPNATAIQYHREVGKTESLTYRELDYRSTLMANYLKAHGFIPGTPVGVCMPRSLNSFVTFFAVLKAGGVYVPLELDKPLAEYKIQDANIKTVICNEFASHLLKKPELNTINLDDDAIWSAIITSNPNYTSPQLDADSKAYVIYTSGTTGVPKGVVCSHKGVKNLLDHLLIEANASSHPSDQPYRMWHLSPHPFDASIYDFIKMLAERAELHLSSDRDRSTPDLIQKFIREHKINFVVFLPALMKMLNPEALDSLTHIITMGEAPQAEVIDRWFNANPKLRIDNGFGPTEAGICTSIHPLVPHHHYDFIGKPITNMQMYVLHPEHLSLCPQDVVGEIYIAGPGVAAGYLFKPEQNQKVFKTMRWDEQKNAFAACEKNAPGAITMFATGDYGCFKKQENNKLSIAFKGRKDRRVKMNGAFPIDLGGMENLLRASPLIQDVVITSNDEHSALTAYIVPKNDKTSIDDLRAEICKYIKNAIQPAIAYPRDIILVNEIPKTRNGKVDIHKLVEQNTIPESAPRVYKSQLQKNLIHLWAQCLAKGKTKEEVEKTITRLEKEIPTYFTFEALGGDSYGFARLYNNLCFNFHLQPDLYNKEMVREMTIDNLEKALGSKKHLFNNFLVNIVGTFANSFLPGIHCEQEKEQIQNNAYERQ